MVPTIDSAGSPSRKGSRMVKPLFASVYMLVATLFTMPGCGKFGGSNDSGQVVLNGKPAPEIAAVDLDGVPFKLSDHRGKVVALSFWAHW